MELARRFQQIFECLCSEDYGSALTLVCPLIDGAGKKLYRIKKTGKRFKKGLEDNNDFLYQMMTNGMFRMEKDADLVFYRKGKENINLSQSIYKLVRNSLLHEGELSSEIEFVDDGRLGPDDGKVVFPKNLIWALVFMVSYLPCYKDSCPNNYILNISGVSIPLQEIWGNKEKLKEFFEQEIFKRNRTNKGLTIALT